MKSTAPHRRLRERPDLDQLRRQAKELLHAFRTGDRNTIAEVNGYYRDADPSTFALHDAQLVLARSYGFESWPKLKAYVDGVTVERLAEAVRSGDVELVRAMLAARPELVHMDMASNNEHRALHYAVLHRRPEVVRVLMQHGADARKGIYPHRGATTALTIARERGDDDLVAIIEEEEQCRDAQSPHANPVRPQDGPLTTAVRNNQPEMLAQLLDAGLDPDERRRVEGLEVVELEWGMPLWHCAHLGRHAMAEMLLERGADPNGQVYASGSPMFSAYGQRDSAMIELLRRYGGAIDAVTAALYGEKELAEQMLAGELDGRLHEGTFAGETMAEQLLWGAACSGYAEIVQMALQHVDWPRHDPRWYAILEQPLRMWKHGSSPTWRRDTYLPSFQLVLDRADANVRGRFGRTLLHDVVAFRERMTSEEGVAFASTLLDAGARLDVRDDLLESTPLGWACRWGHLELVQLFIERGADVVETDAKAWATPRAWAEKMEHGSVLEVLLMRS